METTLRGYRTEILVPEDRVLLIHLPEDIPTGRALVVVQPLDDGLGEPDDDLAAALDLDRTDMEWWDEFEADDR